MKNKFKIYGLVYFSHFFTMPTLAALKTLSPIFHPV
jgi:hypothetical protein